MGLTQFIVERCADLINSLGYVGIFILMFFESTYVPIPSFAVMPFVGFVAHEVFLGTRKSGPDFWLGILAGVLGGLCGSVTTYFLGRWAGPVTVKKWGRYGGLVPEDLDKTHALFEKWGAPTIFVGRFIPVVRHLISTVAGIANMSFIPFVAMSVAGMALWDLWLTWAGWKLRDQYYEVIHHYQVPVDIAVIAIFGGGALYLVWKLRARVKARKNAPADLDATKTTP
jgi:membrane protein DedA with SNARE-associated domain